MDFQDDLDIENEDYLLRRVPVNPMHVVFDQNLNRKRPTSAAFEDHPNGSPMSVSIEKDLFALGEGYDAVLRNQPTNQNFSLAKFQAGIARQNEQIIARQEVDDQPAHGVVVGNKSKKIRSRFAKAAEWAIPPE